MDQTVHEKINELTRRINELARQQTGISQQLVQLIDELDALKREVAMTGTIEEAPKAVTTVEAPIDTPKVVEAPPVIEAPSRKPQPAPVAAGTVRSNTTFEEFVGKNLASKVGILVTILGIFIGAKYAIDHDMISPVMRIVSGYICGLALVGVAIKLRKKYEAYSAVLMGGGLAVLYFITFIAYSFYQLFPHIPAFILMLICTVSSVYAALVYNKVIIAHLGQVGAYCIPFLLSNNSGQYAVLFTYIAIINTGIMVLSFKKYWKSLFYAAFFLTWIIYLGWFLFVYSWPKHTMLAWTFLGIFFTIFYTTFLSYKLVRKEKFAISDVTVLLGNSFAFYGIGYGILADSDQPDKYTGLFTVMNAVIHLVISQVMRRLQLADRNLYYLVLGLVIVFCTIAIPVQFDGNWVTLLWTAEAVLVFIIGRTRQAPAYEKLGGGLILLSFLSLMQDWTFQGMDFASRFNRNNTPFFNITFVCGLLVAMAQAVIIYFNRNRKYAPGLPVNEIFRAFFDYALPALFLCTCYLVVELEIYGYFTRLLTHMQGADGSFQSWYFEASALAVIVQLLYTMVFVAVVTVCNLVWVRSKMLGGFSMAGIVLLMLVLLAQGWAELNYLAALYFEKQGHGLYFGLLNISMRYLVMAVAAGMLYAGKKTANTLADQPYLQRGWSLVIHTVILSMLSAEYLLWTTVSGAGNQFKLGLSIVWGVYALLLIVLGIRQKQKHLRLAAIVLFLITLIKLFLYDLAGSGTITKTISFISLGVILLLVSFLYNKYKEILFGDGNEASK